MTTALTTEDLVLLREYHHRRQREQLARLRDVSIADFAKRTKIEVPTSATENTLVPFEVWPAQRDVLRVFERDRLIIVLKARQLGLSWLTCLFTLRLCTLWPGQPALYLSRGQLEANELIRRTSVMYHAHADKHLLPKLTSDLTAYLGWENGSSITSLAATKEAGRSLTASLAVLDEWAFMRWPRETLNAIKPTIDAGGKLIIISTADGLGSTYHQHWLASETGQNGYTAIFLPWTARPDRDATWRERILNESKEDPSTVKREYPENALEAFTHAAGLVYDVWSDGPVDGNVTEDAEYEAGAGPIIWGIDDGYAGTRDSATGGWTANSHPRTFLLCQLRHNGTINVFAEQYAVQRLSDEHLNEVLRLPYPRPEYAVVDKSAAELKGRLHAEDIATINSPGDVEESIKELRRALAPDQNGRRRIRVHPRCKDLRREMATYRYGDNSKPIKAFDHGPDALRYICWSQRYG